MEDNPYVDVVANEEVTPTEAEVPSEGITISWVRHAEATSNLLENNSEDHYDDDLKETHPFQTKYRHTFKLTELIEYASKTYKPFIEAGLQKLRDINMEEKKTGNAKRDEKNIKDLHHMLTPIGWTTYNDEKKDALNDWLKADKKGKFKPPSSWLFTPTLTYIGIKQAIHLGKTYLNDKIETYDKIVCSASVRTILTALYAVLSTDTDKTIYIVPYINEATNGAGLANLDRANMGIPIEIIANVLDLICKFIFEKRESFNLQIENVDAIRKRIDFTYYQTEANEEKDTYNKENLVKFKNKIIPILDAKNILAFTHGNLINAMREDYAKKAEDLAFKALDFFPNNCTVWKFKYNTEYEYIIESNKPYHDPQNSDNSIRKTQNIYDEINNRIDVFCSSLSNHSLRGDINQLWMHSFDINGKYCYDDEGKYTCKVRDLVEKHEQLIGEQSKDGGKKNKKTKRRGRKTTKKYKHKKARISKRKKARVSKRTRV